MASPTLRDRFLTPPVARAMLSPLGITLAGLGAGLALASGLPLVVAPVAAVAAWGARVAAAIPRSAPTQRIDPFTLPEPWRGFVVECLKAQVRYRQSIAPAAHGPIRDRLEEIGARIDDGVQEAWRIARRGAQLVEARAAVDDVSARRNLGELGDGLDSGLGDGADGGDATAPPAATAQSRTAEALRSQIATADRLDRTIEETVSQLRLLDARLDESVARAAELSVRVDDVAELGTFGADVDSLVQEMESLRLALEETSGLRRDAAQ